MPKELDQKRQQGSRSLSRGRLLRYPDNWSPNHSPAYWAAHGGKAKSGRMTMLQVFSAVWGERHPWSDQGEWVNTAPPALIVVLSPLLCKDMYFRASRDIGLYAVPLHHGFNHLPMSSMAGISLDVIDQSMNGCLVALLRQDDPIP